MPAKPIDLCNASPDTIYDTVFDAIVVGSGPGGATIASELANQGQRVLVLEWGNNAPLTGSFIQMAGIAAIPGKSAYITPDLSLLIRGITAGGSSAINYATAMAPPTEMFLRYGIDLTAEIAEVERTLPISTLPDDLIGPKAHRIKQGAQQLGLNWQKLDKFIDIDKCRSACHLCSYGCPHDAKWNARLFLDDATEQGAQLLTGAKVTRVLTENNRAVGVQFKHKGQLRSVRGDNIILAAGGIGSAQILQSTGITNAGQAFFIDPVIAVMGRVPDSYPDGEIPMAAGLHLSDDGIMLSDLSLPKPFFHLFTAQVGKFNHMLSANNTLSLMVKVKDELSGNIGSGWVNKRLQSSDKERLESGAIIAEGILREAGADQTYRTHHFAAHQGGSARIGDIVDSNLQTDIQGLYVCDTSVIPESWGLPPTYTLICLAKRLAKHINKA
ncbi:FAD-dependent oxidoreductase [Photobacterium alginatilyticum]|uniref:GMC family oxidoreductase n=1 Tax=Photobacterium alginatilyticum TaxID=1775171 RepID=A0ABW9YRH2_9GAMM|nr:GMC family oxidoreductase [Photobacterium alginatilyticum]NBI56177.1 GMC family oxidoreductase [Photobacterium alginatilyticum]